MIEIRKALHSFFKSIHPRVYFQQAPDDATFPYVVYDFQIFDDGEGRQIVNLDIDGWDKPTNGDTTALETLMTSVNGLNKKTLTTDTIVVTFYLENKIPLTDDDVSIKRRRYTYTGYLYERS